MKAYCGFPRELTGSAALSLLVTADRQWTSQTAQAPTIPFEETCCWLWEVQPVWNQALFSWPAATGAARGQPHIVPAPCLSHRVSLAAPLLLHATNGTFVCQPPFNYRAHVSEELVVLLV